MKYFLDTEFYEDGSTIDLISIGVVAEDGREFYRVNADFNWDRLYMPVTSKEVQTTDWLKNNVLPYINRDEGVPKDQLRHDLLQFVWPYESITHPGLIQVWGYYADYDWVAVAQLFGRMIDLPPHWPMMCMDVKQFAVMLGNPQLPPRVDHNEHHALADARWTKQAYDFLAELQVVSVKEVSRTLALKLLGIE